MLMYKARAMNTFTKIIRRVLAPCLFVMTSMVPMLIAQTLYIEQVDTTSFPLMRATVRAVDAAGIVRRPMVSELRVREEGEECTVINVSDTPQGVADSLSVVLMIDLGHSTDDATLRIAQAAAHAWIHALDLGRSECAIAGFDSRAYLWQDLTTNRSDLIAAIDSLEAKGGVTDYTAALVDPLAGGLTISGRGNRKRVIVLMTDGRGDVRNLDSIAAVAQDLGCTVFAVMLHMAAPPALHELALRTGGHVAEHVTNVGEAERAYIYMLQIARDSKPHVLTWQSKPRCRRDSPVALEVVWNQASDTVGYHVAAVKHQPLIVEPSLIQFTKPEIGVGVQQRVLVTVRYTDVELHSITSSNPAFSISPSSGRVRIGDTLVLTATYRAVDNGFAYTEIAFGTEHCTQVAHGVGGQPMKQPTVQSLTITAPTAHSVLVAGSDVAITWDGVPYEQDVRLDYSTNGGYTWQILTTKTRGRRFMWKSIPSIPSGEVLLRVWHQTPNSDTNQSNPAPKIIWQRPLGGLGNEDRITCITGAPDGAIIATGIINGSGGDVSRFKDKTDVMVVKLDPETGQVLWKTFVGESGLDGATAVTTLPDGAVIVAGYLSSTNFDKPPLSNGDKDGWVAKLDGETGALLWQRVYGGSSIDEARSIIVAADGTMVFVGTSISTEAELGQPRGREDVWIARLDTAAGNLLSIKKYGGTNADYGVGILELSDGSFIIGATTNSNDGHVRKPLGNSDIWILRLNPDLDSIMWERSYGGAGDDMVTSLLLAPDGSVVVSGSSAPTIQGFPGSYQPTDVLVFTLDPKDGEERWRRKFGGNSFDAGAAPYEMSRALTMSVDGNIVLTTSTW
ncbi:MAG: VWA domain-containing protein, partial [Candidatus Kapabacteria bacterium]|nr:VWA domain-containing protein [Candidatus Kapabacteria bacterium]